LGFFLREASRTLEWSSGTLDSLRWLPAGDIVKEVGGSYKYYCYILANFDPLRAEEIWQGSTVEQVTKAMMARFQFNRVEDA